MLEIKNKNLENEISTNQKLSSTYIKALKPQLSIELANSISIPSESHRHHKGGQFSEEEIKKFKSTYIQISINKQGFHSLFPPDISYETENVCKINDKHIDSYYASHSYFHEKCKLVCFPKNKLKNCELIDTLSSFLAPEKSDKKIKDHLVNKLKSTSTQMSAVSDIIKPSYQDLATEVSYSKVAKTLQNFNKSPTIWVNNSQRNKLLYKSPSETNQLQSKRLIHRAIPNYQTSSTFNSRKLWDFTTNSAINETNDYYDSGKNSLFDHNFGRSRKSNNNSSLSTNLSSANMIPSKLNLLFLK